MLEWFAIISAGVCFGLVLFVAVLYWWVRMKFRKLGETLGEALGELASMGGSLPHFRISLIVPDEFEWHHPERMTELADELTSLGFDDAGQFQLEQSPAMRLQGFVDESRQLVAAIYDVEDEKRYGLFDFISAYEDGTEVNYSNKFDEGFAKPPFMKVIRDPEATPADMLERCLTERRTDGLLTRSVDDFKACIEASVAREMNWRVDQGGFSIEEVRSSASADGKIAEESALQMTQAILNNALSNGVDDVLREGFLETSDMSAAEWEKMRDRLAFIHGMTEAETLVDHLSPDDTDDEEDDDDAYEKLEEQVQSEVEAHGPIEAFRRLIDQRAMGAKIIHRASVTEPVKADIYILPERDWD